MESGLVAGALLLGFAALALGALAALPRTPSAPAHRSRRPSEHTTAPGHTAPPLAVAAYLLAALGSAALAAAALATLVTGLSPEPGSFAVIPSLVVLRFQVDVLSAYFLLLIGGLGLAGSIYGIGYDSSPTPMWHLFIGAMAGVTLAADGLGFLLLWELMSIASFLLVMRDHREAEVRRAGYFYAVMTHLGTAFLVSSFAFLLSRASSLDFTAFRAAVPHLSALQRNLLFLAACVGFGTKAGLVPLHLWLPGAHPAAPSHVSALMSGAMVKTAIYGLLRFGFVILGAGPAWWGELLLLLGAVSAVAGALYATQQVQIKRLLAYSTIENIGLLVMTLGAAFLARSMGLKDLSSLALGAMLFHTLGHAAFKGLAFLGAGAVIHATGTAEMEQLGGLIRRMPRTATLFLVGVMGMAALPLFSGFIGEWLSLQAFLHLAREGTSAIGRLEGFLAVGATGLTAGLVGVAAVKLFGIPFLALPRSRQVAEAHDAGPAMTAGMGLLALAVLALGLLPGPVLRLGGQVASLLLGSTSPPFQGIPGLPPYAPLLLPLLAALALAAVWLLGRGRPRWRRSITWTCGIEPNARMEYSGAGFSKPILLMFRGLLQPVRTLRVEPSAHPLFPGQVHYQSELKAVFEITLYRPVVRAVLGLASRMRGLQTGSLQTYLIYLLVTVVGLIIWAR